MARPNITSYLPHIFLFVLAALLMVGLFSLVSVEQKNTSDIVRFQEILGLRSALQGYYVNHASYPPLPGGAGEIGVGNRACLSDQGFVGLGTDACRKKAYTRTLPVTFYTPLAENGIDPCASSGGCPHFSLSFELETDILYPKGPHLLTDQGIQ